MEIIGAGFGRTGTSSLFKALTDLGFKCYHMSEVLIKNNFKSRKKCTRAIFQFVDDWCLKTRRQTDINVEFITYRSLGSVDSNSSKK